MQEHGATLASVPISRFRKLDALSLEAPIVAQICATYFFVRGMISCSLLKTPRGPSKTGCFAFGRATATFWQFALVC